MRILVTGAAGFLGSHLVEKFLNNDFTVIAVDDMSSGSLENLKKFNNLSNFSFLKHDVRVPINLQADIILNLACPASPKHYQFDPIKTIETNFLGMSNLLQLAKKNGAKILQASTSEIYGDPMVSPQNESYWGNVNPIGIRSCYDEGKRAAETLCFDYKRQFNLDVRVIRIFNTYGPKMSVHDGRVVSNFITQAIDNHPITIYGTGSQTRSFCYVSDTVEAIFKAATMNLNFQSPINLGNPCEFTINELAEQILRLTDSRSKIIHSDLPTDDPSQRKPDISLAKKILNWEPKIDLQNGLLETIKYFQNLNSE
jgi:UDP-glucuronate decarboxylase